MPDRKPFDPTNPYDVAVEAVRKAVLSGATAAETPGALSGSETLVARVHGATMAVACLVALVASPRDRDKLLAGLIGELPTMLSDTVLMIERGGHDAPRH